MTRAPVLSPAGHPAAPPRTIGLTPWGQLHARVRRVGGVLAAELSPDDAPTADALLAEGLLERAIDDDGTPILRAVRPTEDAP